jgi:hypothetical protein
MSRTVNKQKVLKRVVELVSVYVVDNLVRAKSSAEMFFHNVTMLKSRAAFGLYDFVTMIPDVAVPFSVSSLFSEKRIAISLKPKPVLVAEAVPSYRLATPFNFAKIRGIMFLETAAHRVFNHSVHCLSSITTSLLQTLMVVNRNDGSQRVNSGEAPTGNAVGNPEPSRRYTAGRCNDYRSGLVHLMTGMSARPEREEIVYSLQ